MFFYGTDSSSQTYFPLKTIGQRQDIIPMHIIKWTYRKGVGDYPTKGDMILCNVGIYLIDGTQIYPNSSSVTKFIYGKDLLIEGLEIVFSHCKKGQIFKVKISSEYGYDDRDEIKLIPPNSSLIFEINVLNIMKPKVQSFGFVEAAQQIKYLIEKSDDELRKQNPDKAIQILHKAFQISHVLKNIKSPLGQKIIVKMVNIRLHEKKVQQALQIIENLTSKKDKYFIVSKSKIKIYEQLGRLKQLVEQMKAKYLIYYHNEQAKKQLSLFFRKVNCLQELKALEEEAKKSQKRIIQDDQMVSYYPLGIRGYFF